MNEDYDNKTTLQDYLDDLDMAEGLFGDMNLGVDDCGGDYDSNS